MSLEEQNLQVVQQFYGALIQDDEPAMQALVAEDLSIEVAGPPAMPTTGCWKGQQGLADVLALVRAHIARDDDGMVPTLEQFVAQGDTVVLIAQDRCRCMPCGGVYEGWAIHVVTLREGRIARIRQFLDTAVCQAAFTAA